MGKYAINLVPPRIVVLMLAVEGVLMGIGEAIVEYARKDTIQFLEHLALHTGPFEFKSGIK